MLLKALLQDMGEVYDAELLRNYAVIPQEYKTDLNGDRWGSILKFQSSLGRSEEDGKRGVGDRKYKYNFDSLHTKLFRTVITKYPEFRKQ